MVVGGRSSRDACHNLLKALSQDPYRLLIVGVILMLMMAIVDTLTLLLIIIIIIRRRRIIIIPTFVMVGKGGQYDDGNVCAMKRILE